MTKAVKVIFKGDAALYNATVGKVYDAVLVNKGEDIIAAYPPLAEVYGGYGHTTMPAHEDLLAFTNDRGHACDKWLSGINYEIVE
jgi:hypothetical protein